MKLSEIRDAQLKPVMGEARPEESASLVRALDELIGYRGPDWEAPLVLNLDQELADARAEKAAVDLRSVATAGESP